MLPSHTHTHTHCEFLNELSGCWLGGVRWWVVVVRVVVVVSVMDNVAFCIGWLL